MGSHQLPSLQGSFPQADTVRGVCPPGTAPASRHQRAVSCPLSQSEAPACPPAGCSPAGLLRVTSLVSPLHVTGA